MIFELLGLALLYHVAASGFPYLPGLVQSRWATDHSHLAQAAASYSSRANSVPGGGWMVPVEGW